MAPEKVGYHVYIKATWQGRCGERTVDAILAAPEREGFDPADRKYVAVALASSHRPVILNAVDSDWRDHEDALKENGLRVEQLCPQCMKESP